MRKYALLAVITAWAITTVALAVIYNNRAEVQGSVNVVAASPGLIIASPANGQVIFLDIAPGIWGAPVPVTVRNDGGVTYTSLRLESTSPEGLGLYMDTPPIMPLPPGGMIVVPLKLYAQLDFTPGAYIFTGWIIGER